MVENIKVRWLTDHEQTKVAPKTLSSQVYNEDGKSCSTGVDLAYGAGTVNFGWNHFSFVFDK